MPWPGLRFAVAIFVLKSLPATVLPPPEITPSETERLPTATPRLVDARPSNACIAVAAAERSGGPALDWMPVLPPVLPELTMFHESQNTW